MTQTLALIPECPRCGADLPGLEQRLQDLLQSILADGLLVSDLASRHRPWMRNSDGTPAFPDPTHPAFLVRTYLLISLGELERTLARYWQSRTGSQLSEPTFSEILGRIVGADGLYPEHDLKRHPEHLQGMLLAAECWIWEFLDPTKPRSQPSPHHQRGFAYGIEGLARWNPGPSGEAAR